MSSAGKSLQTSEAKFLPQKSGYVTMYTTTG